MRQGNGTDLLGNDPRSASIGIIYVSPNDDRKSVLAAIITQEKFARKQVAIVLPPGQNKAFQRPVDFDDLKNMRRRLQTEIVFIAPGGPGPAEFARQRRFPVYSSLESYARAIRDDQSLDPNSPAPAKKGGWSLFGSGRQKAADAPQSEADNTSGPTAPLPAEKSPATPRGNASGTAIAGAAAGAAALGAADLAMQSHNASGQQTAGQNMAAPPAASAGKMPDLPMATNSSPAGPVKYDLVDDAWTLPPTPTPAPAPSSIDSEPTLVRNNAAPPSAPSSGTSAAVGSDAGPGIIELSPRKPRGKETVKLPVPPAEPPVAPVPPTPSAKAARRTAPIAAAAGAAGAAAVGAGAMAASRASGAPPGRASGSNAGGPNNRRPRRNRNWLLLVALVLFALLLSCAGLAYAQPTTFGKVISSVVPSFTGPVTVTVVPDSQVVSHSYVVSAVTGNPDPNQLQVKANPLSYTTPAKSSTVSATGRKDIAATPAKGTLSFINGGGVAYTFGTKTPIVSKGGVTVYLDAPVTVPPGNPVAGTFGKATGTATTASTGVAADIPAQGINTSGSGNAVTIVNYTAFTGGQDAAHYNYVLQSDIDNAAKPLESSLQQEAQSKLQAQASAQQPLANNIQCTPKVTPDHPAGDTGVNVPQVTVSVSETCTAISYDAKGLQGLVAGLLRKQVTGNPALGADYELVGSIVTTTSVEKVDNGTVFLNVAAKGTYAYSKLDTEIGNFPNLIKGLSAEQAIATLKKQPHVADVSIPSGVTTLPTDPTQIKITIQLPAGFPSGGSTNGGSSGTPGPVTGNGSVQAETRKG